MQRCPSTFGLSIHIGTGLKKNVHTSPDVLNSQVKRSPPTIALCINFSTRLKQNIRRDVLIGHMQWCLSNIVFDIDVSTGGKQGFHYGMISVINGAVQRRSSLVVLSIDVDTGGN